MKNTLHYSNPWVRYHEVGAPLDLSFPSSRLCRLQVSFFRHEMSSVEQTSDEHSVLCLRPCQWHLWHCSRWKRLYDNHPQVWSSYPQEPIPCGRLLIRRRRRGLPDVQSDVCSISHRYGRTQIWPSHSVRHCPRQVSTLCEAPNLSYHWTQLKAFHPNQSVFLQAYQPDEQSRSGGSRLLLFKFGCTVVHGYGTPGAGPRNHYQSSWSPRPHVRTRQVWRSYVYIGWKRSSEYDPGLEGQDYRGRWHYRYVFAGRHCSFHSVPHSD